jgi:hypothetical protein
MLEKICTDLETSKRLKELGFEAETDFYWTITTIDEWNKNQWNIIYFKDRVMAKYEPTVPAYTLEQIINELPESYIDKFSYHKYLTIEKCGKSFYYEGEYSQPRSYEIDDEYVNNGNFATIAAKLWIKLKEDEII